MFVKTTRNRYWFIDGSVLMCRVGVSEPLTPAPSERFVKVTPPSVLTCHCTAGGCCEVALAVKVAWLPAATLVGRGCCVILGAATTVTTNVPTAPPFPVAIAQSTVVAPTWNRAPDRGLQNVPAIGNDQVTGVVRPVAPT